MLASVPAAIAEPVRCAFMSAGVRNICEMRTVLLAASLFVLAAAPARAQVIEIADDGSAQVFDSVTGSAGPAARYARTRGGQFNVEESLNRAAHDNGLDPGLLRAVAWQESRGNNLAVSNKGALGIMQLMPGTAAALGVDPRDPEANIKGGAAYLALQMTKFGNVELALAAYNAGPGAVIRYGGVPPYRETRSYVSTIMLRWNGSTATLRPGALGQAQTAAPAAPKTGRRESAAPILLIEVETE